MKIELQRGLTIKGKVVKPDGQPVNGGFLLCRRRVWSTLEELRPLVLTPQGTFNLDGCEPGQTERVLVVDSTRQWGAVADLQPAASAAEPVTIRAEQCGLGTVTLVDADGKPLPDVELKLMVSLPEPGAHLDKSMVADPKNSRIVTAPNAFPKMFTDREGKMQLPFLIPKASYQIVDRSETLILTDPFQVGPGQKIEVKIRLRKPGE
jgi:hypothetical protein